jgi:hypothetical protein
MTPLALSPTSMNHHLRKGRRSHHLPHLVQSARVKAPGRSRSATAMLAASKQTPRRSACAAPALAG